MIPHDFMMSSDYNFCFAWVDREPSSGRNWAVNSAVGNQLCRFNQFFWPHLGSRIKLWTQDWQFITFSIAHRSALDCVLIVKTSHTHTHTRSTLITLNPAYTLHVTSSELNKQLKLETPLKQDDIYLFENMHVSFWSVICCTLPSAAPQSFWSVNHSVHAHLFTSPFMNPGKRIPTINKRNDWLCSHQTLCLILSNYL